MAITEKEDNPDFKGELAWLQKPEIVCSGAQITDIYTKTNLSITENDFKSTTAKAILFRYIKQLLSECTDTAEIKVFGKPTLLM